jgi:hypothetical protein
MTSATGDGGSEIVALLQKQHARSAESVERRAVLRLRAYWLSLRWSRHGPFFADFKPTRNPIAWDHCALMSSIGRDALVLDHVGGAYRTVFGIDDVDAPVGGKPGSRFESLFGAPAAAFDSGNFHLSEGRYERARDVPVLYRSILLPFVDNGGRPAYVLAAVSYTTQPARED